jgi:hypothetical protein
VDERQWLGATDPRTLLEFLQARGLAGERKARLFAVACCRRVWHLLVDERLHEAVEAAEDYADGRRTPSHQSDEYRRGNQAWRVAFDALAEADPEAVARSRADKPSAAAGRVAAAEAAVGATYPSAWMATSAHYLAAAAAAGLWHNPKGCPAEFAAQCELIRDVFGNPFRHVRRAPVWRERDAWGVANEMYEARDFAAMPVLADALQDAGCDVADVLEHCRDPARTHVRGCWVVDLVLGLV